MSLRDVWRNYKVLIVMGPSLGLLHLGWYHLKTNSLLHPSPQEPGIAPYAPPKRT